MMKKVAIGSIIATLACGSVSAQAAPTMEGVMSFGLGAGKFSDGCEDCSASDDIWRGEISTDLNLRFSDAVSMGFEFSHSQTTLSYEEGEGGSESFEIDATRWSIKPRYAINDAVHAGAYAQNVNASILSLDSKGLFGGYDGKNFALAGYAGQTELGGLYFSSSEEIKANNLGVSALIRPMEGLEVFGHFSLARLDVDEEESGPVDSDDDIKLAGAGAEYSFGNGWSVYGATTRTDGAFFGDDRIQQAVLGAGIDLASFGSGVPGSLYVDWTRSEFGEVDAKLDLIAINWTVGFGGASVTSQNCTVRNARGANPAPFSALLECLPGQFGG